MKLLTCCLYLLFTFSLFAQTEKGVTPVLPSASEAQTGNTYAVVIGISDYQDAEIPDLQYAHRDAEAFAHFLRSPAGGSLDEDHLKLLTNEQATSGQVAAALDWLIEVCEENDKAIIYFSGHGDVEGKKITQPGFLLCWDAPPRTYTAGGTYSLYFLELAIKTLSQYNKSKVMVVSDACRSGKLAGSEIGGSQLTHQNLAQPFANEIKILSCQPDEYSIEGEQWGGGRGAFSYHLIDGLYGLADRNADEGVSLSELDRYLEDHVTPEVAPHYQLPMTVGNGREQLVKVFPELLEQVKKEKTGNLPQFSATDSKGMEEEVLAQVDTSIRRKYKIFKQLIAEKKFLEPTDACADIYYEALIKEIGLEKLHFSMWRNYAAALQDDAQQVLNKWLKSDAKELTRPYGSRREHYQLFPHYLERAAELLGKDHYMYDQLRARKFFFEGFLLHLDNILGVQKVETELIEAKYREALKVEPELPFVYYGLSTVLDLDSAEYYANKAVELVPTWVLPYIDICGKLERDRVEYYLDKAMEIDSNSFMVRVTRGNYFIAEGRLKDAEVEYKKSIQADTSFIGGYVNLGRVYIRLNQFKEAEYYIKKAIQSDTTQWVFYGMLGELYVNTGRYEEIEGLFQKMIRHGGGYHVFPYAFLGKAYCKMEKCDKAVQYFEKSVSIANLAYYEDLVECYHRNNKGKELEGLYEKAIQAASIKVLNSIALGFMNIRHYDKAEKLFSREIKLDAEFPRGPYNMACLFSLQQKEEDALYWLEESLKLGKIALSRYQQDADLENIQNLEAYRALMKKYFPEEWKE